ncbi:MAG TPA: YdeI/OmpD-associated family protein [Actinomycetota bacterium]|nr:YdeI/OmpD-associated family protein [Actinomycetota bacterium]
MKFRATLERSGKTATGVEVPSTVVERLGAGKRPAVRVTINGHSYRSSIASMDGRFMLGVSAENREKARVAAGDVIDVDVEVDTAPREVSVPKDLAAALWKEPKAKATFESLSYSNQSWHVLAIEGAKTEETRQRRIAKSIATLRQGKPR